MCENVNVIKGLDIKNFRGFQNQKLELGPNLTILFGQNGSLKSTILGMIAQPFYFSKGKSTLYTKDYIDSEGNPMFDEQINGKAFESKYGHIFRMSETDVFAHNEKRYEYYIEIKGPDVHFSKDASGDDSRLMVRSQYAKESVSANRFRLVGGGSSHKKGAGNFPHPVIFLGLNRLYPLALSTLDEKKVIELSDEEKEWFSMQYRYILSSDEQAAEVSTSSPKEGNKPAYVLQSDNTCNYKSASAGQDNVGQIVSAVLSFRRLKSKLNEAYRGGLLLIDEMDATLHPIAQKKLLAFLVTQSKKLSIQVIATSHSANVLEESFFSSNRQHVRAVKIERIHGKYKFNIKSLAGDVSYTEVYNDLFHSFGTPAEKLLVMLEDESAADCLKVMVGTSIYKNLTISSSSGESSSCQYLKWLASYDAVNKKLPLMVVLDGDQTIPSKLEKRAIALLGGNYPEAVLYNFFMHEYDWATNSLKLDFSADACFEGFREADRLCAEEHKGEKVKDMHKRWYRAMSNKNRLGQTCAKGWRAYRDVHIEDVQTFVLNFHKLACDILKNRPKEYRIVEDCFVTAYKKLIAPSAKNKDEEKKSTENTASVGTKPKKVSDSETVKQIRKPTRKKMASTKEKSKTGAKGKKSEKSPNQLDFSALLLN